MQSVCDKVAITCDSLEKKNTILLPHVARLLPYITLQSESKQNLRDSSTNSDVVSRGNNLTAKGHIHSAASHLYRNIMRLQPA